MNKLSNFFLLEHCIAVMNVLRTHMIYCANVLNDWPAPGLDDTGLSESGLSLELRGA